jgi:xanthosine utilization system XapX-like protein
MNTTWLLILLALGAVALVGTVTALVRQRAPRVPADAERLAQLRDRSLDQQARRLAAAVEEQVAHRLDAPGNGLAPQMAQPVVDATIWGGAVPAR